VVGVAGTPSNYAAFCATAVPSVPQVVTNIAMTITTNAIFVRFNMIASHT